MNTVVTKEARFVEGSRARSSSWTGIDSHQRVCFSGNLESFGVRLQQPLVSERQLSRRQKVNRGSRLRPAPTLQIKM